MQWLREPDMHDNVTGIVTTIVSEYIFMYEQGFSINS